MAAVPVSVTEAWLIMVVPVLLDSLVGPMLDRFRGGSRLS